jgi:hypothetical protein
MKIAISERQLKLIHRVLNEQSEGTENNENKQRCHTDNVLSLDEIVGNADDFEDYAPTIKKRRSGVKALTDSLELMKNLHLHSGIKDDGAHLAYDLLGKLNKFKNKNYFDETNSGCLSAMDKVIELYKEDEHGEELVKDIEKVMGNTKNQRTKEYLKQCLAVIKGGE